MMDFAQLIMEFGFPIACVIALGLFVLKFYNDYTKQTNAREEKLYEELKECRAVNSKAIETIAQYADSLGVIQTDIKEIKADVELLTMNK
jgi:hypothetical protein